VAERLLDATHYDISNDEREVINTFSSLCQQCLEVTRGLFWVTGVGCDYQTWSGKEEQLNSMMSSMDECSNEYLYQKNKKVS